MGDFERIVRGIGFRDPRIVSKRRIAITNTEIEALVGNVIFYSITYRLWKLDGMEDACEDYGHKAVYTKPVRESPFRFKLDSAHVFHVNKPERVCGNTALMLSKTRYHEHFEVLGSFDEHFGSFDCASSSDGDSEAPPAVSNACGC